MSVLFKRCRISLRKAKETNEHFGFRGQESHQVAAERALAFCASQENQAGIYQQINSKYAQLLAENKMKLRSIAATVIFCGKQGLAYKCHRDDGPVQLNNSSTYNGNIQALLRFQVDADDNVQCTEEHLKTASHNATYTSKEIQNQMIVICGDIIRNQLLLKIQNASIFKSLQMRQPTRPMTSNWQSVFST